MFNLCIFLLFNITQKHKQNPKKEKVFKIQIDYSSSCCMKNVFYKNTF